ncbi:hypothetical protein WA026_002235 [Henosepilachna vigintioctopunctata]|uniref:Uncharacterized protein n=1 Tax=Henosepilachna vigintioctopunctata TaxID=420089 RepID=A0AAW1TU82_9CUCU
MGEDNVNICVPALIDASSDQIRMRSSSSDSKKIKKPKLNHENKEGLHSAPQLLSQDTKAVLHNYQMKEKQKERRGSDSELSKSSKKILDSNGIISEEKKRRLSQSDSVESTEILGSTNIGTMVGLPKPRKEKVKNREVNRNKNYSKTFAEKLAKQQLIALPTGEIDMEAKFKQRLLEGVNRSPHRTEQTAPAPEKPPLLKKSYQNRTNAIHLNVKQK